MPEVVKPTLVVFDEVPVNTILVGTPEGVTQLLAPDPVHIILDAAQVIADPVTVMVAVSVASTLGVYWMYTFADNVAVFENE